MAAGGKDRLGSPAMFVVVWCEVTERFRLIMLHKDNFAFSVPKSLTMALCAR